LGKCARNLTTPAVFGLRLIQRPLPKNRGELPDTRINYHQIKKLSVCALFPGK
jgi:hypothetical protein